MESPLTQSTIKANGKFQNAFDAVKIFLNLAAEIMAKNENITQEDFIAYQNELDSMKNVSHYNKAILTGPSH